MRVPDSLAPLLEYGVIEDVVRPLMSGKEAQVYLVVSGGKYAVAKIYKEAQDRTFKHRSQYTEGRKVRNTRDQRAIQKRSKHGRQQDEAAWRSTEVDMIRRLHAAGVRVPVPYQFLDGVLVMELITDAEGNPAPRLGDLSLDREAALAIYERLIREVVRMLAAGVVHGDLSEFNVLVGADGPVIIDFPQSVDSAHNTNARRLLLRDVDNLHRFLSRVVPNARRPPHAQEMWHLYEQNLLTPDTRLRGDYRAPERRVNTASVSELIDDANRDERRRRDALGLSVRGLASPGPPQHRGPRNPPHRGPAQQQAAPRHPGQQQQAGSRHPGQQQQPGQRHPGRRDDVHRPAPRHPEVVRIQRPPRPEAPAARPPHEHARPSHEPARRPEPRDEPPRAVHAPAPPGDEAAAPRRRRIIRSGATPERRITGDKPKPR